MVYNEIFLKSILTSKYKNKSAKFDEKHFPSTHMLVFSMFFHQKHLLHNAQQCQQKMHSLALTIEIVQRSKNKKVVFRRMHSL